MNFMSKSAAAALAALLFCSCSKPPAPEASAPGRNVLLIGNSFTAANGMPATLAAIAASLGQPLHVDSITPGGRTLEQHSGDKGTLEKLKERRWDAVVLQEQSQRPAWPDRQFSDMVLPYAVKLAGAVRDSSPGASVIFFGTWGYKDGDKGNCAAVPEVCSYAGMQARLDSAYAAMAAASGAALAPVGKAWAAVRAEHPEIELYFSDGIHPSAEGSYLAACVIYAAISGKSPVGADRTTLAADRAELLQEAAARAAGK
jgi:hypothetical protein